MSVPIEREMKLAAPEDFQLPSMEGVIPGLSAGSPTYLDLDATYFDTPDLALARAGATLRYRRGEPGPPWTLKLPERIDRSTLTRRELRFDGTPDIVPDNARDLVRAYVRCRQLEPVARLHTRRTLVSLRDSDGSQAAELVDDIVSAFEGQHQIATFHEVELELTDGVPHPRRLQRAALKRLSAAGCQADTPRPKLVRALGERASAPPDVTISPIGANPSVVELIRHALSASVDRLLSHDAGVRLGDDPEDVHQFRVAARTLRSNLKTFGPVLDRDWAGRLRAELGWLGTEAGGVRDLDVLGQRLRHRGADLTDEDATGLAILLDQIAEQRDQARTQLLVALRSDRYDRLIDALIEGARTPVMSPEVPADAPARRFLRRAARRQVRRLDRTVATVSRPPTDTDLHLIRIQAKRTRYAIEAARPVIGRPAVEHAAALARLQDILGDLHDSIVAVQWLRNTAATEPAGALVAGQFIAAEGADQSRLRGQVKGAWRTVAAKPLRRWL